MKIKLSKRQWEFIGKQAGLTEGFDTERDIRSGLLRAGFHTAEYAEPFDAAYDCGKEIFVDVHRDMACLDRINGELTINGINAKKWLEHWNAI